jgi:hypothetical protein
MFLSSLLEVNRAGVLIPPSLFVGACAYDMQELIENAAHVVALPVLAEIAKKIVENGRYDIIPKYCFFVNRTIRNLSSACLAVSLFWDLSKPIRDFVMKTEVAIDVAKAREFLATCNRQIQGWQRALDGGDCDIETLKTEVSGFCGKVLLHSKLLENAEKIEEAKQCIREFEELEGKFKFSVLEEIANKIEPIDDAIGSTPHVNLGLFLRSADYEAVCRAIGWEKDDGYNLCFKLAEKGIFSKRDLVELFSGCTTSEERVNVLIDMLKDPAGPEVASSPEWEWIKQVAFEIDRVVASVVAVACHVFAILAIWDEIADNPLQVPLHVADGIFFAHYGHREEVSRSAFVKGGLKERLYWMMRATSPIARLSSIVVQAWKERNPRAIPDMLYNTYLA